MGRGALTVGVKPEGGMTSIQGDSQRSSAVHSFLQGFVVALWHKGIPLQAASPWQPKLLKMMLPGIALLWLPYNAQLSV